MLPKRRPVKIMIWCAARGGMRSVVEAYQSDGFVAEERITLIASYVDGTFVRRQAQLLFALMRFLLLLAVRRVELVHCHAAMRGSFWRKSLFASIARLCQVPTILHLHGSEMKPFWLSQTPFAKSLIKNQLESASRVIVLSESWRMFVQQIAPLAHISILPNYVAVPNIRDENKVVNSSVLFLGLIGDRKGVFDLLPSFNKLLVDHPDARLLIGGNGETERANKEARSLGVESSVDLLGWIDELERHRLLSTSSIYVLPSYNEGLPMSVLEAMAMGLPVVTTRAGGLPELIDHGIDGLLINAGDREALTDALGLLLSDRKLRETLGSNARKKVNDFYSEHVILPRLASIYRDCERNAGLV